MHNKLITQNIQWLISLGGTVELIQKIAELYCLSKQFVITNKYKSKFIMIKSSIVFVENDNNIGHWVYYNNNGIMYDSYNLDHQKYGSQNFCQTYAILYMLGHNNFYMKKKFTDRLKPGKNNYSNNIKVVVCFWRYMFNFCKPLMNWMINEVKFINDYDILHNYLYITNDSKKIDKTLINKLLMYIYINSHEISG
jgi:hypothetical protein